jgi:hypothetical protein
VSTCFGSGVGEGEGEGSSEGLTAETAADGSALFPSGNTPRFIVQAGSTNIMHTARDTANIILSSLLNFLWFFIVFSYQLFNIPMYNLPV